MVELRSSYGSLTPGMPKDDALGSFKSGNKVKLGSALIDGVAVEEWKVEAFHDQDKRKDLFVVFLYFANDRLADSNDRRIDFRNDASLVAKWKTPPGQ